MTLNARELVILNHRQWLIMNSPPFSPWLNLNARGRPPVLGRRTNLACRLGDALARLSLAGGTLAATICSIEGFRRNPFPVSRRLNLADSRSRREEGAAKLSIGLERWW